MFERAYTLKMFIRTRIYFCLSRGFVNQHVLFQIDLHWDRPKLTWRMHWVCVQFVFKTILMPFESDTRWSFYFYTSGTFHPILTFFTHFALHQFFYHVYYHAEYCFFTPDDAVDRWKATVSLVCFFLFFFFLCFW